MLTIDNIISFLVNKVPSYGKGTRKIDKKKIQKFLFELEFDDDVIENINDDFLLGFECARSAIIDTIKNERDK